MTAGVDCGIIILPLHEGSFFVPKNKLLQTDRQREAWLCFRLPDRPEDRANNSKMEVPHMAANGKRVKITLSCTECKQRNYNTMKNKQNTPDRLEMNKYCRFCRKHTLHKESK